MISLLLVELEVTFNLNFLQLVSTARRLIASFGSEVKVLVSGLSTSLELLAGIVAPAESTPSGKFMIILGLLFYPYSYRILKMEPQNVLFACAKPPVLFA